jgi:hypothetical protein
MKTNPDLLLSILAMDSYNRGYNPGLAGLGDAGSRVGSATLLDKKIPGGSEDANFYAAAYELDDGGTVISFRGTDQLKGSSGGRPESSPDAALGMAG